MSCLVLDAMGVIFNSADDVAELLIPFVAEKSGSFDEKIIQSAYLAASLGNISPDEFWEQVNVVPELEDAYLSRHSLNAGIVFLIGPVDTDNGGEVVNRKIFHLNPPGVTVCFGMCLNSFLAGLIESRYDDGP